MKLEDAKKRFIQIWGTVGVDWGINRTMAQIHALLLVSSAALSTEQVMAALGISRGNANMNLRELDPMMKMLNQLSVETSDSTDRSKELQNFKNLVGEIL